jgi:hypothetical protein
MEHPKPIKKNEIKQMKKINLRKSISPNKIKIIKAKTFIKKSPQAKSFK